MNTADKEQVTTQFKQLVCLSCLKNKHISCDEEHLLLSKARDMGLDDEMAFTIIRRVCSAKKTPLQSDVENHCAEILQAFHELEGCITQQSFIFTRHRYSLQYYNSALISIHEIERRLKRIILKNQWLIKEGGFLRRKWFFEIA